MSEKWLIIGAFGAIYIIWGSTYLANAVAVSEIPPFLMAGTRFLVAGGLLYGLMLLQGKAHPTLRHWRNGTIIGVLFLSLGNGALVMALKYIDSGLTSLIVAFDPLLLIFLMWILVDIRPGGRNLFGILLGVLGMAVLIGQPTFIRDDQSKTGLWLISISMVSWALGSIYVSRVELPRTKGMSTAVQMIAGGIILLIYSFVTLEYREFSVERLTLKGILAWNYLVFFGSIIAFSSFNYLLHKVTPDKVSTSTLINPVVALFLGWMFNNEQITMQSMIAAVLLLSGVFFINTHKSSLTPKVGISE
ncbi:MAG: EamA family transporter [Saprospiraceae bacterium]|nr:EamA family transporter [Saprospiraceae bacterium]MCB9324815.1 EamA family transporter [Lewinellaceae bacterium]